MTSQRHHAHAESASLARGETAAGHHDGDLPSEAFPASSPQLGRNFFAIIEDSFTIPSRTCSNLMQPVKLEMQHVWDERLWPLATLGLGKAGAVNKMIRFVNNMQMHSETDEDSLIRICRFLCVSVGVKEVSRVIVSIQFQPVSIISQHS